MNQNYLKEIIGDETIVLLGTAVINFKRLIKLRSR